MIQLHKPENLSDIAQFKEDSINADVILKNNDSLALLVSIKENQIMPEHNSPVNAFIYVIKGSVNFIINTFESNETFKVQKGEIFMFNKEENHKLIGLEDSIILVIRI